MHESKEPILWLSRNDVLKTGICNIQNSVSIVESVFKLFADNKAVIIDESKIVLGIQDADQAFYVLPAYVDAPFGICGVKWSAHGQALQDNSVEDSRIHAALVISNADDGRLISVMNGTDIGAARTGAVTAVALKHLAPINAVKATLCGAGGQAERQLEALIYALPQLKEISVWSRSGIKNHVLVKKFQPKTSAELHAADDLTEALSASDIVIGATSAPEPYLDKEQLKDAALYCHIGFNEISLRAIRLFDEIIVDTWEEAKNVSGQSLFRNYRSGDVKESDVSGILGDIISNKTQIERADKKHKIMFDAFGLPIFDIAFGLEAYNKARDAKIGQALTW